MREKLGLIIGELRRRRQEGDEFVYVAGETLKLLKNAIGSGAEDAPRPSAFNTVELPPPPARKTTKKKTPKKGCGEPLPKPPVVELPEGNKRERLEWLRNRVLNCPVCNAHVRPGKKIVFGAGDTDAAIFFCGEAPGAEEEEQGEPFVGRAGQLLTKAIQAMGLKREDVFIGNIMKWRPEMPDMKFGNRPPTREEMDFCLPYLKAQAAIIQPKIIVALGKTAVCGLLGRDPADPYLKMGDLRGHWLDFSGIPFIVTYHPSYLVRNASMRAKRLFWEDLLQVMEYVGLPISAKQRAYFKK